MIHTWSLDPDLDPFSRRQTKPNRLIVGKILSGDITEENNNINGIDSSSQEASFQQESQHKQQHPKETSGHSVKKEDLTMARSPSHKSLFASKKTELDSETILNEAHDFDLDDIDTTAGW